MNKVVLEHYPASKLPDDIRGDLPKEALVRVIVEDEGRALIESRSPFAAFATERPASANLRGLLRDRKAHPGKFTGTVTTEEAVARIRELRDEWEDR